MGNWLSPAATQREKLVRPQFPVMYRLVFLDQPRFQQQGTEFSRSLDPFHARDFLPDSHVPGGRMITAEMGQHP